MGRRSPQYTIMDDAKLARMAYILGSQSAAALALADAERQRKAGKEVVVVSSGSSLIVCSSPAATNALSP